MARQMLNIEEEANYLGTTARHGRRLVGDDSLSHCQGGGREPFADVDLATWVHARRVVGVPAKGRSIRAALR